MTSVYDKRWIKTAAAMPEQIEGEALQARPRSGFWSFLTSEVMDHRHIVPMARGHVLELTAGSTSYYKHYKPEQVTAVTVLSGPLANRQGRAKSISSSYNLFPISEAVDFKSLDSHSYDCVLSTYFLCREGEVNLVLQEIYRVLKPGGQLLFCEPGRHRSGYTALMQDWVTYATGHGFAGRHVNRPFFRLIKRAGFEIDLLERGTRLFHSSVLHHLYCGVAVKKHCL